MRLLHRALLLVGLGCLGLGTTAVSQQRVGLNLSYERLLAVVSEQAHTKTLAARNTLQLALFKPLPAKERRPTAKRISRCGRESWGSPLLRATTDNSRWCSLWPQGKADLKEILADPNVKYFVKGKTRRIDIETEFRKFKADINLDRLEVSVP